jgi:hypothetical protein
MMNSYNKLQNLRQVKKVTTISGKTFTKPKATSKRKVSKDKRVSKYLDFKKQSAKGPISFETANSGFQYISRNPKTGLKPEKQANNSVVSYIPINKRNSSMEELKLKSDISGVKSHKRSNQDQKSTYMTMTANLVHWDDGSSVSPSSKAKSKNARDKLKKLTTHLGNGASRNSASKGIMSTNLSKGSKKGKFKSPKYMTQGVNSYYTKSKNASYLSR